MLSKGALRENAGGEVESEEIWLWKCECCKGGVSSLRLREDGKSKIYKGILHPTVNWGRMQLVLIGKAHRILPRLHFK